METAIYHGDIHHKRFTPNEHAFSYQLSYLFLDLDKVESAFSTTRFWSVNRPNLVSFQRQDYLPGSTASLKQAVLDELNSLEGPANIDQVFLLATPRSLGHCMNPIALYFCYAEGDLSCVLAEVHNTPWDERHTYLVDDLDAITAKNFHVSPFMPMNTTYHWKISDPNEHLVVAIRVEANNQPLFTASMTLARQPLNSGNANQWITRFVKQSFKTMSAIYCQAAVLWLKKVPFYGHPKKKIQEAG